MTNPLVCLHTYNHNYTVKWIIAEEKDQDGRKLFEKSGLSHMRSFVIVIRSVYFGAQKRRDYAKSVGVNRSVYAFSEPKTVGLILVRKVTVVYF